MSRDNRHHPTASSTQEDTRESSSGSLRAILRMHPGHAVPDYVQLRSSLAADMFTVNVPTEEIDHLKSDPRVHSFSFSTRIPAFQNT